jgi:uracil-DNA glycosylase family 4
MRLDARQRALLREIGVKVWWPAAAPEAEPASPPAAAGPASPKPAAGSPTTAIKPRTQAAASSAPNAQAASTREPAAAANGWQLGPLQALHAPDDPAAARGPRWLLLAEQRQDGGSGDAQRLMQAMLRAAGLHRAHTVWLAPLVRTPDQAGVTGLEDALAHSEPDLVFIMGRLAAWALLESNEPLGQLRGQIHDLWGMPAVVSYDCASLLRHPVDKGKAWSDLCLALQVARAQHAERSQSEDP